MMKELQVNTIPKQKKMGEIVYEEIRKKIIQNEILIQQTIYETKLAEQFNVSRTPVREALMQLVKEGLLVEKGRGYKLPTLNISEVKKIYQVRKYLETSVLDLGVSTIKETTIKKLTKQLDLEKASNISKDIRGFIRANRRFNLVLMSICSNEHLLKLVNLYSDRIELYRAKALRTQEIREKVIYHHKELLIFLEKRDTEGAKATLATLLEEGIEDWGSHLVS